MTSDRPDLEQILSRIRQALRGGLDIPDGHVHTATAALGLFRVIMEQSEAIELFRTSDAVHAAPANLRSLFEAWIQLRYLLKCCDSQVAASVKCRTFAVLELRDFLVASEGTDADPAAIDAKLADLREVDDEAVEEVVRLRAGELDGSRFYWTGLGPTALVRRVQDTIPPHTRLADQYKFLSWDAHHIMAPLLNATLERRDDDWHIQVSPRQAPEEVARFTSELAAQMVKDAWSLLRTELSITPKAAP